MYSSSDLPAQMSMLRIVLVYVFINFCVRVLVEVPKRTAGRQTDRHTELLTSSQQTRVKFVFIFMPRMAGTIRRPTGS